jgi:hypothetical protein
MKGISRTSDEQKKKEIFINIYERKISTGSTFASLLQKTNNYLMKKRGIYAIEPFTIGYVYANNR